MAKTKKNKTNKSKRMKNKGSSKSKTRKLKLKKLQCGPEGNKKKYTCLRDESICKLKTLWNKRHPDDKIKNGSIRKTWKQLKNKLQKSSHSIIQENTIA